MNTQLQDMNTTNNITKPTPKPASNNSVQIEIPQPNTEDRKGVDSLENEPPELSNRRKYIIVAGLCMSLFLSVLDRTIVSTVLPTIGNKFNALSSISWVLVSNLLTSTAFQPLYGKLSDIFGRKQSLLFTIIVFGVGSIISGCANNITTLIISRGITGIGAAGISVLIQIIISEIVTVRERGKFASLTSATFGVASLAGPLLGGIIADRLSWRWCFFINLPIGAIATVVIITLVKVKPTKGSMKEKVKKIDFLGMLLFLIGLTLILLALNLGGVSFPWKSPLVVSFFIVGFIILCIFVLVEMKFAVQPIIPMYLFRNRNVVCLILALFLASFGMYGVTYYMPLYYTVVHNGTAEMSGVFLVPYIITYVIFSIGSGNLISRTGHTVRFFQVGTFIAVVGQVLTSTLSATTPRALQILYLAISGVGTGCYTQSIMVSTQASVEPKDLAVVTSLIMFAFFSSGAISVSIISTILKANLNARLAEFASQYPEYTDIIEASKNNAKVAYDASTTYTARNGIIDAYVKSLQRVFIVTAVIVAVAFISTLFVKNFVLEKKPKPQPTEKPETVNLSTQK
ncbi:hypothetical protein BB559_006207 [Furculomyces boomerangus]|uniref:Major facilitator superfamily (MFS) profile domain-containing protein n=1 Tax=Furculomyces boomerangus TaxID=61424 RepID=A0A2T9Y472_9FUNG|nr:hypothetical protein BB559_006207 [Furculomyces boomerangus]